MAGRGRPPKPTALKLMAGNPGKRKLPEEIACDEPIGEPPSFFNDDQIKLWNDTVSKAPPGLLTWMDRSVLKAWVVANTAYEKAAKMLDISRTTLYAKLKKYGI